MTVEDNLALIALDWGTTSLRAYAVAANGRVLAERQSDQGILNVPDGDFAAAFHRAVGEWLRDAPDAPVLASGMIASRNGWVEAPYIPCPAALDGLANQLISTETPDQVRVWFVPGVNRSAPDDMPDVMRGEETQVFGAVDDGMADGCFVLPGTHSKWVSWESGRLAWFSTFMTGEVYDVLIHHSILGRLTAAADGWDKSRFADGVAFGHDQATSQGGLLRKLFSARSRALFDQLPETGVADYLSGLLIGAELAEATAVLESRGQMVTPVILGRSDLIARYQLAMDRVGLAHRQGPADSAVSGLHKIAVSAGLLREST